MEELSDTTRKSNGFTPETEKEVFEIQLVQLQKQLESAMIEKEQMGSVLVNSAQMNTLNFHKNMCNERYRHYELNSSSFVLYIIQYCIVHFQSHT